MAIHLVGPGGAGKTTVGALLAERLDAAIAGSSTTFVLLPSLDKETCVAEIVRRQVRRPLGLSASTEEAKIRTRFSVYRALPALKVETIRSPDEVVMEILDALPPAWALHPNARNAAHGG